MTISAHTIKVIAKTSPSSPTIHKITPTKVTVWRSFIQGQLIELPKGVCAAGVIIVGEDGLVGDIVNDWQQNNNFHIWMVQRELIVEVSHHLTPIFLVRH